MSAERVVVIVSGGDAVSPFTSPDEACRTGIAAGNTDSALRAHLLGAGMRVFTAPAMNEPGPVAEPDPTDFGAFGGMPTQPPEACTILSTGPIDAAGAALARFIGFLHDHYGVRVVDWVGHSNGGLFARAATRILKAERSPVAVGSLTTLGTPWSGGNLLRIIYGEVPESECRGQESCLAIVKGIRATVARQHGLAPQNTAGFLSGPTGWNQSQAGVLDGIPVFLIAGTALDADGGDPEFWPNDGLVSAHSALATDVSDDVVPDRTSASFPLLHSIFIAQMLGESWESGMTWNPQVLDAVTAFIARVRGDER